MDGEGPRRKLILGWQGRRDLSKAAEKGGSKGGRQGTLGGTNYISLTKLAKGHQIQARARRKVGKPKLRRKVT